MAMPKPRKKKVSERAPVKKGADGKKQKPTLMMRDSGPAAPGDKLWGKKS